MSSPKSEPLPKQSMLRQAAEWFALLADDSATEQDKQGLQTWLAEHPDHRRAWQYAQRVGQRFQQANSLAGPDNTREVLKAAQIDQLRRKLLIGGGLSSLALGLGLTWRYTPLATYAGDLALSWRADHSTRTGETQHLELADGGQLWLNSATAVNVRYGQSRRIELQQGEIFIQTASDSHASHRQHPQQRPFVVSTQHGLLTALGTRFGVYQRADSTLLTVFSGAVRINTARAEQRLAAGQQAAFNNQRIGAPAEAQSSRQSWVKGVLFADNMPLQQFIEELSRYQYGHIGVDEAVAMIPVIGAYPIQRPAHALRMLENALPIRISQTLPWWTEISAR